MNRERIEGLTVLGGEITDYSPQNGFTGLESFPNKYSERDYLVTFDCPEFTSLCPVTGQPDFAAIRIYYVPDKKCLESKSLKLYLFSFRNKGMFHEEITNRILDDVVAQCNPRWACVKGVMNRRGGICIEVTADFSSAEYKPPSWILKAANL